MEDPDLYANPCYAKGTHTSVQGSHDTEVEASYGEYRYVNDGLVCTNNQSTASKSAEGLSSRNNSQTLSNQEATNDKQLYIDLVESTKVYSDPKSDNKRIKSNGNTGRGKRFSCVMFCLVAVLVLISVASMTLSVWNTFQLNSSTAEEVSNLQQGQLGQNQVQEFMNALLDIKDTMQNFSSYFQSTNNRFYSDLNQLNDTLNVYASEIDFAVENLTQFLFTLELKVQNLSDNLQVSSKTLSDISTDIEQVNYTVNINKNEASVNLSSGLDSLSSDIDTELEIVNNTLYGVAVDLEQVDNNLNIITSGLQQVNSTLNAVTRDLDRVDNNLDTVTSELQQVDSTLNSHDSSIQSLMSDIEYLWALSLNEACGHGNWRRLMYLNMSISSHSCPSSWREYATPVRSCGRAVSSGGSCSSWRYYTHGTSYNKVCGRVVGYQYGTPDAHNGDRRIDEYYVDGISITYKFSSSGTHHHIWTLSAGYLDAENRGDSCECRGNSDSDRIPSFVGNNYFCESGNKVDNSDNILFHSNDSLWDGHDCENTQCCSYNSPPWFSTPLTNSNPRYIEVRICGDESTSNEDTPIELLEIYVSQ